MVISPEHANVFTGNRVHLTENRPKIEPKLPKIGCFLYIFYNKTAINVHITSAKGRPFDTSGYDSPSWSTFLTPN